MRVCVRQSKRVHRIRYDISARLMMTTLQTADNISGLSVVVDCWCTTMMEKLFFSIIFFLEHASEHAAPLKKANAGVSWAELKKRARVEVDYM